MSAKNIKRRGANGTSAVLSIKSRIRYGPVFINPKVIDGRLKLRFPATLHPTWQRLQTFHEGDVLYYKLWNFWVRAGVEADLRADLFFPGYESVNPATDALLTDAGFTWSTATTEEEIWARIGRVWNFLQTKVVFDNTAYA